MGSNFEQDPDFGIEIEEDPRFFSFFLEKVVHFKINSRDFSGKFQCWRLIFAGCHVSRILRDCHAFAMKIVLLRIERRMSRNLNFSWIIQGVLIKCTLFYCLSLKNCEL